MILIDAYVVLTLLAVMVTVTVAAVAVVGVVAARLGLEHRRRRLARHESIPAYYRHLALHH